MRRAMSSAECSPDSSRLRSRLRNGAISSLRTPGCRSPSRRSIVSSACSSSAENQSPGNCQSLLSAMAGSKP